jgi:hypothetical protein
MFIHRPSSARVQTTGPSEPLKRQKASETRRLRKIAFVDFTAEIGRLDVGLLTIAGMSVNISNHPPDRPTRGDNDYFTNPIPPST